MMILNNLFMLFVLSMMVGAALAVLLFAFYHQYKRYQTDITMQRLLQQIEQLEQFITDKNCIIQLTQQKLTLAQEELIELSNQLSANDATLRQYEQWQQQYQALAEKYQTLQQINSQQLAELREIDTRLQETRKYTDEKQQLLVNSEQRLSEQFENLANRIFEQSHKKIDEHNKQSLNYLLFPLKNELEGFRKQVQDGFGQEAKERYSLTHEIKSLQQLNQQMAKDAINLTNALKGNNKIQGSWGEVILSRVLENSGLRLGHEYHTQVNLVAESGEKQQPDVIVSLPQNRCVIIDAKMSLIAYEKYFNSEDHTQRQPFLQEHIYAIRQQIKNLAKKQYQQLPELTTLDYVLLFIPIENAFSLAIEHDPTLINEALKQNVMLASPSSLIVILRTINNLWRFQYQNDNARIIADKAAKIYDKLRLFIEDMLLIGESLNKSQQSYHSAMKKLSEGKGNLVAQAEQFRQLGVEVKKPISDKISENSFTPPLSTDENSVIKNDLKSPTSTTS